MNYRFMTSALLLLFAGSALAMQLDTPRGRAVLMNNDQGEWKLLLARNVGGPKKGQWSDFSKEKGRQKANIIAAEAVKEQTKGVYQPDIEAEAYAVSPDGDYFYFVPVKFIPGKTLYEKASANNPIKDDFMWVLADDILQKKAIMHPNHGQIRISDGVYKFLRQNLKDAITLIETLEASAAATAHQTYQGSTWGPASSVPAASLKPGQSGVWGPNKQNHIYFYDSDKPYYAFTNFYPAPVKIDGKIWPTTEHYYQAQKFPKNPRLQEKIRGLTKAREAFKEGRAEQNKADIDPNWEANKFKVMQKALEAKFSQHPDLKKLLKSTGTETLVEDAGANDAVWGAGADYNGINALGSLLQVVRASL